MRNRFALPLGFVLALLAAATGAQEGSQPGLSPESKKLDFLVGKWTATGRGYPPGSAPTTFSGTTEVTWMLGGRYLMMRSTITRENRPPFDTLRLFSYDPREQRYRMWVFDSSVGTVGEWVGKLEGEKIVLVPQLEPSRAGHIGITRVTYTPEGYLQVGGVVPNRPAARAGLKAGDLITRINGTPLTPEQARDPAGPIGTAVRLTVRSGDQERELALTREGPIPVRMTFEPGSKTELHATEEAHEEGRWRKIREITYRGAP
jgi:membrane-associated protease RseP (regulator of RpoE activity)